MPATLVNGMSEWSANYLRSRGFLPECGNGTCTEHLLYDMNGYDSSGYDRDGYDRDTHTRRNRGDASSQGTAIELATGRNDVRSAHPRTERHTPRNDA